MKLRFFSAVMVVTCVLVTAAFAIASEYHAILQFSGAQGENQWFYQYWDGAGYHDMTFNAEENRWEGPEPWLHIYDHRVHPSDTLATVRKWVAPRSGTIYIAAHVRKGDVTSGNGINARVLHNTAEIFNEDVAFDDDFGYYIDITLTVEDGDVIYFVTDSKGDSSADATLWEEMIVYLD